VDLHPRTSLFGHKTPVTNIAVSKAFSTFVTVSQDGITMLWDLNRLEFIRKLPLARPVECARINDMTGEIMLCSGPNVLLYTLNGDLILDQNVCGAEGQDDFVHSCAFYEGSGNEWLENSLIFTGHKRGRVNVWRKTVGKNGRWILEFQRRLDHANPKSEGGANVDAPITCIMPMPQLVYTGDDDGRVVGPFPFQVNDSSDADWSLNGSTNGTWFSESDEEIEREKRWFIDSPKYRRWEKEEYGTGAAIIYCMGHGA